MHQNAPISLSPEVRERVGSILNHALADEFALSSAARDYHWNVTGPQSRSLNELFNQQYHQIDQWIEKIADRARTIGITAQSGWSELIKAPRFTPPAGAELDAHHMIVALAGLHESMAERLRQDADVCRAIDGDAPTAELLTELLEYHDTMAWMLRELLEDRALARTG
jgi:starvation-inducible DNA-binding protein